MSPEHISIEHQSGDEWNLKISFQQQGNGEKVPVEEVREW